MWALAASAVLGWKMAPLVAEKPAKVTSPCSTYLADLNSRARASCCARPPPGDSQPQAPPSTGLPCVSAQNSR